MASTTARAVSLGLVGAIMAVLFFTQGLIPWAAFVAWAAFLQEGGDGAALKKTVAGTTLGAVFGWVALLLILYVAIPDESWLWMPRTGLAIGLTLALVGVAAGSIRIGSVPSALCGFASVLGVSAAAVPAWATEPRLLALRQYNPLVATVLSMAGGVLFAYGAARLAERLTRK